MKLIAWITLGLALTATPIAAQTSVPSTIPFQGRLTKQVGGNANGVYGLTFRIYTAPSGGLAAWTESHPAVSATNGLFKVELGSIAGFPPSLFDGRPST